jgi:intein/homing endonuclease
MWIECEKYRKPILDVNEEFAMLKGELSDDQAKITLAKFLYRNLGFTVELLSGVKLYPDQIISIKAMLLSNYMLCIWARGLSKCTAYDPLTQVFVKGRGLISITDLVPKVDFSTPEHWMDIGPFEFWNGEKWATVTKALTQPKVKSRTIKTSRGYELGGSTRHLIKVWDSYNCKVVWRRYSDIKVGDYACISRSSIGAPTDDGSSDFNDREAYLIGLLLGGGHVSERSTSITSADEEIIQFAESFPTGPRLLRKDNKALQLNFRQEFIRELLNRYGVKKVLSYDKEIPESILKNRKATIACLSGLFDTDGYSRTDGMLIGYCSVSHKMASQVHLLLNSFGIISRIREDKTNSPFGKAWIVMIMGENCRKFSELIGFRLTRKKDSLNTQLKGLTFNTNVDVIPGLIEYCQREIKSKYRFPKVISDEWRMDVRRRGSQKNLSYASLNNTLEFFKRAGVKPEDYAHLEHIKKENFFFDEIVEIEDKESVDCLDFNVPDGECFWNNGFVSHNTFTAAIFAFLQCLFFPGTQILIAGPTFRTSRFIFNTIEKIADTPEATMLAAALGVKTRRNDEFNWQINGGSIVAIPLNGEKIRGFRANCLIIDEMLLMSEEIVEKVLIPFLVAQQDQKKIQKIREQEDIMIAKGMMTEAQRYKIPYTSKMIALSSASYTCEPLYKRYDNYIKQLFDPKMPENGARYAVSQLAWNAIDGDRIDKSIIELANSNEGGDASPTFLREYGARFVDGSDNFFSINVMSRQTIPDGEDPTLLLRGKKDRRYIVAIDPCYSSSEKSDAFAMCLVELGDGPKIEFTVVNQYAESGKDMQDHAKYLHYLLVNFNVVMLIVDYAGSTFIDVCGETDSFRKDKINLKMFDFNSDKDGAEYEEELRKARRTYNRQMHTICFAQYFTSDFIRKANEYLQGTLQYANLWFGSSIKGNSDAFNSAQGANLNISEIIDTTKLDRNESPLLTLIDMQEMLIKQVKYQCAAIEVKSTAKGTQTFDLPQILKRDSSVSRIRKDSYTALMLAAWGAKCYFDIMTAPPEASASFTPILI